MRHRHALLASTVALVVAVAGCQDGSAPTQPDSRQVAAQGGPPGGPPGNPTASCDATVTSSSSIQAAVDAAASGDRICVESGTYTEQVVINKDLTLQGFDDPVIEAPASPGQFTIPESGPTWEPVVFAFGGSVAAGAVTDGGTVQVEIRGFVIDGGDRQPDARRAVGIFLRNAHGTVAHNTVRNMGVGGKETMGILAYGDSHVRIAKNTVSDYERGGIAANGDGGAHPAPNVTIENNHVTGSTGIGEAWAPNGIQVGFGATGRIVGNTVEDNRWNGDGAADWVASCILVFESDGVQIRNNEASNCDAAIGAEAWAWFLQSVDNVKVHRNSVEDALFGIVVRSVAFDGFSSADPSATNNTVIGNQLDGGSIGQVGIRVAAFDIDPDFDPVADNNKVIRNTINGFADGFQDAGTNTKKQVNAIIP